MFKYLFTILLLFWLAQKSFTQTAVSVDTYRKRADIILKARINASYALPPQTVVAIDGNSLVYANSYECLTAQIVLYTTVSTANITEINTRLDKLIAIQGDMNVKFTVLDNQLPGTRFVRESQWYAGYMLHSYLAIKTHLKTYNFNSPATTQKLAAYEAGVRRWYSKFDFTNLSHDNPTSLTNLVFPRLFGGYLATELWPDAIDAYGKPFRHFRAKLKALSLGTLYDFYHGGFTEIDAVSYVSLMATPVKMLGEYAQDSEVKRIATLSFQTILATISMDYNNGMNIVCPSRAKGVEIDPTGNNMHRMQWLFFGSGKEPYSNGTFIPNDDRYVRAMSVWMSLPGTIEASPQLLAVHKSKDSVITWFNDRQENGEYEKKYVLPHYGVGSAIAKKQAAGGDEGKNNIVGWRNLDNSTNFTTICVENDGNVRSKDGENSYTRLYQNQKTIIGTTNIPASVTSKDYYRLFLPIDYTTDQTQKGYIYDLSKPNWIFCHTGRMMYGVAFFGSTGAVPKLQTKDPLLFNGYSHYFLLDDRKAAWVMETADINEAAYKGKSRQAQLNAFRDAITQTTQPRVTTTFTGDPTITYNSLTSGKLSLTYYAGETYNQDMKLNDVAIVNPYVDSVANNPYMRQKAGSDTIELGKKNSPQFYKLVWSGNMPPFIHPRVKLKSDNADFTYLREDRPLILEKGQTEVDGIVQFQGDDPESGKNVTYDIRYLNGPSIRRYGVGSTLRLDLLNLTQDTSIVFKVTDPQGRQTIDTVLVYVTRRPSAKFDRNRRDQYLPTENMQPVFTGKDILRKSFDVRIEDAAANDIYYAFPDSRVDSIIRKLNVNYFKTVGDYVIKGTTRNWVRATASDQLTIHIRNIVIQSPTPNTVLYKAKKTFSVTGAMVVPTGATAVGVQVLVYENNVVSQTLTATVSGTAFSTAIPIPNTLTATDKVQLVARLTYTLNGVQTELSYPLDVKIDDTPAPSLGLSIKAYLQGAMLTTPNKTGYGTMMRDDLRIKNLIPTTDPYRNRTGFIQVNNPTVQTITSPNVLTVTGNNAIVDWVFVELRDKTDAQTAIATKSGLIQRDGNVVDVDGVSPLSFDVAADNYYVVLRHRNHLGVMSKNVVTFNATTSVSVDFTSSQTSTYGTNAQAVVSATTNALWAGDANADGKVISVGANTDVNTLSQKILKAAGNSTFSISYLLQGYDDADIDLNGTIAATGGQTDGFLISSNILRYATNQAVSPSFTITQQLP
jgi:hypothetical protein